MDALTIKIDIEKANSISVNANPGFTQHDKARKWAERQIDNISLDQVKRIIAEINNPGMSRKEMAEAVVDNYLTSRSPGEWQYYGISFTPYWNS